MTKVKVHFILQWIIGGLTTIAFAGGSAWLNHIEAQVDKLSETNLVQSQQVAELRAQTVLNEKRLDRIEQKLDVLIQRKTP